MSRASLPFATLGKAADGFAVLGHLLDADSLLGECSRWAGLDAFATAGAGTRVAPVFGHVADDPCVNAPSGDFPDIRTFELGADPDTARAENAAVVIEDEAGMRHIHRLAWIVVGVPDMSDAERLSEGLQLTMAV